MYLKSKTAYTLDPKHLRIHDVLDMSFHLPLRFTLAALGLDHLRCLSPRHSGACKKIWGLGLWEWMGGGGVAMRV